MFICFRIESRGFTPWMTLAVGTFLDSSPLQFHALMVMDLYHNQFRRINFYLQIYTSSTQMRALENFYGIFSCYLSLIQPGPGVYID
jgi:hypothetical protein